MQLSSVFKGLAVAGLLMTSVSVQASLINGDFSSSTGWTGVAEGSGSATVTGGQGVLETGDGVDSTSGYYVSALFQDVTLATDVSTLSFDASFVDLSDDLAEDDSKNFFGFVDTLLINLYDPTGSSDLLLSGLDSSINTGEIDSFNDGLGFLSFSFDVSSMAGKDIALSFELYDEEDGFNSKVLIDNVAFNTAGVPEPGMLSLLSLGLLSGWVVNRRRRNGFLG